MLKDTLRSIKPAHISLTFVGLMWVLPFLYPDHPPPIASFYAEWIAAILGLCAMVLLVSLRFWQSLNIPRITLLPTALAVLIMIQFSIGKAAYLEQSLLSSLYLLWAALLIILGRQLREELSLPFLATALALFLLIGAELSVLMGLLQHYSIHTLFGLPVVMAKNYAEMTGNLAQTNHLANYLTLGLISLGLLHVRWKLRMWQLSLLAIPPLFALMLTGSRSSWLYFLGIAGMAFLWQRRDRSNLPLLKYSLLLLLSFGLMHWVVQIPWLAGSHGHVTAVERMIERADIPNAVEIVNPANVADADEAVEVAETDEAAGAVETGVTAAAGQGSIRLSIWREAWLMAVRHPLIGIGFGQFGGQHFLLGPELRDSTISGLNDYVEHAHNLVLHLGAETGLAGLIILSGTLALWLIQAFRAPRTVYHWWGHAVMTVLAIHSMLEYPLWYAFFLGVAAVVLGMLDDTSWLGALRANVAEIGRWTLLVMLSAGLLLLSQMLQDYRKLADIHAALPRGSAVDDGNSRRIRSELISLRGQKTLLLPYVESLLGEARWDHIADKRALNERVMRFAPTGEVVRREVLLLAQSGLYEEARKQLERVIWTYPGEFPEFIKQLERLALMDPDPFRFPALLNFAQQKYREWQWATHSTNR